MTIEEQEREVIRYREKLLECGKLFSFENPDNLSSDEILAVVDRVFNEINKIDMSCGFPYHDTGIRLPKSISKDRQEELFIDFIDWYQVIETPSGQVYQYVLKHYPRNKFPRILCVGDGEKCHLGRKLAMQGYDVVSVDPLADKKFSGRINNGVQKSETNQGKFHVIKGTFHKTSEDMINWANVIVGAKVPLCAEELIGLKKPAVFNISANANIYNMRFKGKKIEDSKDLSREIKKCEGVTVEKIQNGYKKEGSELYICDPRLRSDR